jgi:hypothetical protein
MTAPTIIRERTRPGLHLVEVNGLGAVLALCRPRDGGEVLVVLDLDTPAPMLRSVARLLLGETERRHLSRFLSDRAKR